jgi:hydrogenase maturation protease
MGTLVIGVGNILLADEGVGVHAARRLVERFDLPEGVTMVDGGTAGMDLLDQVADAEGVIILDCAKLDAAPGTIRVIEGDGVPAFFQTRISPHQIGLSDLLGAVSLLGAMPRRMALVAVQPASTELSLAMSPTGEAACEAAVGHARAVLAGWGFLAPPRTLTAA